jgi:hypothetical protein
MNIFKNITNGYKKIATGIAIVTFLVIVYIALIPGGSVAEVVSALSGAPIAGAFIKIVEWPQYNATTASDGSYTINSVPYDSPGGSTYRLRVLASGYGPNSTDVTLTGADPNPAVNFVLYPSDPFYIPFVYDQNAYDTKIQVFNPYDINITVDDKVHYYSNGSNKNQDYEILPMALGQINAKQIWGDNFIGSVKVDTTRPAKVQGLITTIAQGVYSIAPSRNLSTETVTFLPFLYDQNAYDSAVQIFNPDPVNTTTANVTMYDYTGVTRSVSFTIAPLTLGSRYAEQIFGGNTIGTVKVETTRPAMVQGNIRTLASGIFSIAPATVIRPETTQYIPFLYDQNAYDSAVQIFNPDPVNTITANVTMYDYTGAKGNVSFTIAPLTLGSRYAEQIFGGNTIGTVKVETTGPALVQGNIRTLQGAIFSIAPSTIIPPVATMYIPYLKDIGTSYDSAVQIFNPYDTETISATITSYNLNGQIRTLSFDIPPLTLGSRYAEAIAGGDFEGSVMVETKVGGLPRPALVQANIRTLNGGIFTVAPAIQ